MGLANTTKIKFSLLLLLHLHMVHLTYALGGNRSEAVHLLYAAGVDAYLGNDFEGCVELLKEAVERYQQQSKAIQNCRIQCHEDASAAKPLHPVDTDHLEFYEKTIRNTLCIIKCRQKQAHLFGPFHVDHQTIELFESRKPYEYLHLCYHQVNDLQNAASAVFTYLVANPNDQGAVASLKFYTDQPEVNTADIVNFEARDYVYLYSFGSKAYNEKDWPEVITHMEQSLASFLQAEEECRASCEGPYDQGWFPDFVPAVANHFAHILQCKRKCAKRLSTLNGEKHDDLLPSHYHYLQFAYFKVGDLKQACRCAASYLLLVPFDEVMMENVAFYKSMPKFKEEFLKVRSEAYRYAHRNKYEDKIMKYILRNFDENSLQDAGGEARELSAISRKFQRNRLIIDNFLSQEDCEQLLYLAKVHSVPGDGYKIGNRSPHTIHENYAGLSLDRLIKLVKSKLMKIGWLGYIKRLSEKAKEVIDTHFDVKKRLHFAYTQLVCRSARNGYNWNRTDLSHAVHADNCNLQTNLECPKKWPAFTWRDYTGILYLNSNFLGGELFFASDYFGKKIEQTVRPTCGRFVAFSSGIENLHGVKAVKQGTRCALAIWLTHNEERAEPF